MVREAGSCLEGQDFPSFCPYSPTLRSKTSIKQLWWTRRYFWRRDTGRKTTSASVRAWQTCTAYPTLETFSLYFLHVMLLWKHCAAIWVMSEDEVTITAIFLLFFFFKPLLTLEAPCYFACSLALTFWASRTKNLFSLFAPLVILLAFASWVDLIFKLMRANCLIGRCMSDQTHTYELMKGLCTDVKSIRCAPGVQEARWSCFSWHKTVKVHPDTPWIH